MVVGAAEGRVGPDPPLVNVGAGVNVGTGVNVGAGVKVVLA